MKSTVGRPRRTSDAQVEFILTWYAEYTAWKARRPAIRSMGDLAHILGVSTGAISSVIRRRGVYKQPSPEHRAEELQHRRAHMRAIASRARSR